MSGCPGGGFSLSMTVWHFGQVMRIMGRLLGEEQLYS
jgi:hypothetical protein